MKCLMFQRPITAKISICCKLIMPPTPVFLPGESYGQRSLAIVHGVARVIHDLVAKPPPPLPILTHRELCWNMLFFQGSRYIYISLC